MDKIAIIGMSCLFPGAVTPSHLMRNLLDKKDLTSLISKGKLQADPDFFFADKKGIPDKFYYKRGGYINDFIFDPNGYAISKDELIQLDDLHHWSLHVAKEAIKDAGYEHKNNDLANCGVVLGNLSFPTQSSNSLFLPIYHQAIDDAVTELSVINPIPLTDTSNFKSSVPDNARISGYPSQLISKALSLSGTALSLDAACATSLYAIKFASDYLLSGKTDLMLAGAVSAADPFFINMGFSIFQAYPETGRSCPLDQNTQGLVSGEGAAMIMLKRYSDAIEDHDKIYAVIDGIGLSNDGKGKFVLVPNTKGQQLAMKRTYEKITTTPDQVQYLECHATGTPLGDSTELVSIDSIWGNHDQSPLFGSVKPNFGHLLTVAGMAGLLKIVLGMNQNTIPATIGVKDPVSSPRGVVSPEKIVRNAIQWPTRNDTKIAAINAFGFGGANAHMVVHHQEQWRGENIKSTPTKNDANCKMAIIGMEAIFGAGKNLSELCNNIYSGNTQRRKIPENRRKSIQNQKDALNAYPVKDQKTLYGAYLDEFEMDFAHFKIPPNDIETLLPQQLLILKSADNAIADAGLRSGQNVGVIVAMEADQSLHQFRGRIDLPYRIQNALNKAGVTLSTDKQTELHKLLKDSIHNSVDLNEFTSYIGNIMASRVSSLWDFTGPAFTVSAEQSSFFRALELAQLMLQADEVDAMVVGAIDLAGSAEEIMLRQKHQGPADVRASTSVFNGKSAGWNIGEGAGVLVLKKVERTTQSRDQIYATIDALVIQQSESIREIPKVCHKSLDIAECEPNDIGYIELNDSLKASEAHIQALSETYSAGEFDRALGSTASNFGHMIAASGAAALIKATLCLHHRFFPAIPDCDSLNHPAISKNSQLYIPDQSHAWVLTDQTTRKACISSLDEHNTYAHLILSEAPPPQKRHTPAFEQSPAQLFTLKADSQQGLQTNCTPLRDQVQKNNNTKNLASEWISEELQKENQSCTLSPPGADSKTRKSIKLGGSSISGAILSSGVQDIIKRIDAAKKPISEQKFEQVVQPTPQINKVIDQRENTNIEELINLNNIFTHRQSKLSQTHSAFLRHRRKTLDYLTDAICTQISNSAGNSISIPDKADSIQSKQAIPIQTINHPVTRIKRPDIVWDEADLLEFAQGNIANVFGEDYQIIDSYNCRVRLPMPPYLLVSRVTQIDAKVGQYKPSSITTEYDIPHNAWFCVDGQIPWAVAVESGQCDLLLISYMGIDFQCRGNRMYRLLDCTLTFVDRMPMEDEVLRYEIKIDSFANQGDTLLFFFQYDCFVGDRLTLKMRGGCAGFFTPEELSKGKGVILSQKEQKERSKVKKSSFRPLLSCNKSSFNRDELVAVTRGELARCFGRQYQPATQNPSLRFSAEQILMHDRIASVNINGGLWGLGEVISEKDLAPDHWYFPCHFKDDQVLAGSLMAEGCVQLLQFYLIYIGLHTKTKNARFQPIRNLPNVVKCRGQVTQTDKRLTYKLEITEIGLQPFPYAKGNVDIILRDRVVVSFTDVGVELVEKEIEPNNQVTK